MTPPEVLLAVAAVLFAAVVVAVALAVLIAADNTRPRPHEHADAGLDILRDRRPQDYDAYPGRPS